MKKSIYILDIHRFMGLFFSCFGLFWILTGLLVFSAQWNSYNRLSVEGIKTTAVINLIEVTYDDDDSASHDVYVTFTAGNREEITAKLNYYRSSMHEGDRIEIYYDPSNPVKIVSVRDNSYIFVLVFCGIGLPFLIPGIIFLKKSFMQKRKKKMLVSYGDFIIADIAEVYQNPQIKLLRGYPSIIRLEYYENGIKYEFKSQNFYSDLSKIPDKLRVWIDRNNFSNYHVDLENLGGENGRWN